MPSPNDDDRPPDGRVPGDGDDPDGDEVSSRSSDVPPRPSNAPTLSRRLSRIASTDHPWISFAREFLSSVLVIVLVGLLLFGVSGVWPPMVAVESGSMEPNMQPGDLVFVMDEGRFAPGAAHADTGVVAFQDGRDASYRTFGDYGDVIVFAAPNQRGPPIIHRTMFWVEEGENWYDRADPRYVRASECGDTPSEGLANCPAPHDGFVTKGDNNGYYDQAQGISEPVRPSWIRGTAEVRVPYLGCVRLRIAGRSPSECMIL